MSPPKNKKPIRNEGPAEGEGISELGRRLEFLELGDDDRRRLQEIAPILERCSNDFVEAFYKHLFAFDETARFLQNPQLVASLKEMQQSHLESMLAADWDEAFLARRRRVGDAHAQIGINPPMFLGAYNQYLLFGLREIAKSGDLDRSQFIEQVLSLLKVVFLDVGLTLDAYFVQATRNLQQALDIVFQANRELRQFAQFTSHDLKTPLATVANYCDEALDEFGSQMPEGACKLIQSARDRVFRMSKTIDELLSSTISLESGDDAEFSSQEVVAEAIEQIRPALEKRHLELKVASHLPPVMGDRVRIREAFYNLLSNAIKFCDSKKGRIAIDCEIGEAECVFSVADNGSGIPTEELSRVFVPFRRLARHHDIPGSGLGLYFTKTIIEQQGGRIWAESAAGKGAKFLFTLKRPAK